MTPVVAREHDLCRGALPVIGDVEEVADLVEQACLALLMADVLAHDDHAVGLLAFGRPVVELGHFLTLQIQHVKFPLPHDRLLDVRRTTAGLCLDLIPGRPLELLPAAFLQVFGQFLQIQRGLVTEMERDPICIPTVQVSRLAELRVASQEDAPKAGTPA